jgi:hypothetical protein
MRLVCDSKASNIIKKIPINPGEITVSEMAFNFNTQSEFPNVTLWFQQLFGFWICSDDLEPTRLLTYENFASTISYNWQDMFNYIGTTFDQATGLGIIPDDEITFSLFMFCCRSNIWSPTVRIQFTPNPNINVDIRGGNDSQQTLNKIDKLTNDIKEQELNELNKTGFVQLTEEQFDSFLSPKNPTIVEVINSLDNTEVQELIENKKIANNTGRLAVGVRGLPTGKKQGRKSKSNKQKTKRKQNRRKT